MSELRPRGRYNLMVAACRHRAHATTRRPARPQNPQPMATSRRLDIYERCNGTPRLTARQRRRMCKKHRASAAA